MTLYEFNVALSHYSRIQSGKPEPMTNAAFDQMKERLRALNMPDMEV